MLRIINDMQHLVCIVIGKREYLNVVFKPLIQVGLSNESTEASSKYQELFNKFLAA